MGNPIRTAMDRLYSIAIGAFVAVLVNVLVFPIWAGEQLHTELVNSFISVADSLEGKPKLSLFRKVRTKLIGVKFNFY